MPPKNNVGLHDENFLVNISHLASQVRKCCACGQGPLDLFSRLEKISVWQLGLGVVLFVPCGSCKFKNKVSYCAVLFLNAENFYR